MALLQRPLAGFSTDTAPDLSDRHVRERLSRSAIPAFFKLIEAWQVRDEAAPSFLSSESPSKRASSYALNLIIREGLFTSINLKISAMGNIEYWCRSVAASKNLVSS